MPRFTSPFDGAQLFYRDYTPSPHTTPFQPNDDYANKSLPTLVFIHGWPMSSLMFDHLMLPLCETYRIRCIAPDRRGFGSSDWTGPEPNNSPINYDVFADDTIHLLEKLGVGPFVFVASSMGPGETVLAHSRSRYVQENCKGFIWMGCAMPFPLATPDNPEAPSREVWDFLLKGFRDSRADFIHTALPGSLGTDAGAVISEKTLERYGRIIDAADAIAIERCVQIITTRDFTEELKKLGKGTSLPILCLHGDKDTGNPYEGSMKKIKDIIPRAEAKIYTAAAHGTYLTHPDQTLKDILGFINALNSSKKW